MVQSPDLDTLEMSGFWPHPCRSNFYTKEAPWKKEFNLHGFNFNLKKKHYVNLYSKIYDVGEE